MVGIEQQAFIQEREDLPKPRSGPDTPGAFECVPGPDMSGFGSSLTFVDINEAYSIVTCVTGE